MGATPFEFKTKSAKLGDLEVAFSGRGRAVITGRAELHDDTVPADDQLPAGSNRSARVGAWGSQCVRDQIRAAISRGTPPPV